MPRMTLYGMYQYDHGVLDDFQPPAFADRLALKRMIISACGDLYPYYQVPNELKQNIIGWMDSRRDAYQKMWEALNAEYNPIHNYDRKEDNMRLEKTHDTDNDDLTTHGTMSATGSSDSSDTITGNTTLSISAYDADTFVNREHNADDGSTISHAGTASDNETNGTSNRDFTHDGSREEGEDLHAYGNIGVTTTQQMITQEIEMRHAFNVYDIIVRDFEDAFIVQIY